MPIHQPSRRLATARGRYRAKLTAGALLLVVVPLLVVAWLALRSFRNSLEEQVRERLYSSMDEVAQLVDRELQASQSQLEVIGDLLANGDLDFHERIVRSRYVLAGDTSISAVVVYDNQGKLVDTLHKPDDDVKYPLLAPHEFKAMKGRMLGRPSHIGGESRLPIGWAFEINNSSHEIWLLVAQVRLDRLCDRISAVAEQRFAGSPDALWVLNRDLSIVANADPELLGRTADLATSTLFTGEAKIALENLTTGGQGIQTLAVSQYQGPHGTMIAGVRTLLAAQLVLVAQISSAQAFAPVTRMRTTVIVAVIGAAIVSALVGMLLARRMSKPVATLIAYTDQLAARNFAAPMLLRTGDELEVLGGALQQAANSIVQGEQKLRDEQQIRGDLGRFLPAQLVDRLIAREHTLALGGVRQPVTVIFADVTAFTSLVERHPPEVVVSVLNQLFSLLTELIFRHDGTVDKFMGDCVMAFWNAPNAQADHVRRAIHCAQDMQRWLESANTVWEREFGVTVHLAIGIHTGEAVVGNFGSQTRMEYTCVGDTVNVAARLEHLARPTQILASAQVQQAAPHAATYYDLGKTAVPGRQQPVDVVEIAD
jgi:adenylate cyclase